MSFKTTHTMKTLWITLHPEEVIELKRIGLDRDETSALTFFREILTPRLSAAAIKRGIDLNLMEKEMNDECIPG